MNKFSNIVLCVLGALIVAFETNRMFLYFYAPTVYLDVHTTTPVVRPGEKFRLSYSVTRRRICETNVHRFIMTADRTRLVWRDVQAGGVADIGDAVILSDVPVPADITPGKYVLITRSFAQCYEGSHMTTHTPVMFEVK